MERIQEICCYYIALLRTVGLVHQTSHWRCKGANFYGLHLLFERIYKTAAEDADMAAERFIGLFGDDVLDLNMQAQMIGKSLELFSSDDPIQTSLKVEKEFLTLSNKVYTLLAEDTENMTLGLDDLIMGIASNRETAVYLLQQSLKNNESSSKVANRMSTLKNFGTL